MDSARITATRCHECGKKLDASARFYEDGSKYQPSEGDISVCIYCGALGLFTDERTIRPPTPKERQQLESHEFVVKAINAVIASQREVGGNSTN